MNRQRISVCILRAAGTNCDFETERVFKDLNVNVKIVRSKRFLQDTLSKYHMLVFPGGFSYGDYVRAGAIWGKELSIHLGDQLEDFVYEDKPILGICNGFQVLVEAGLLPAFNGTSKYPEIALATNVSARYECRWVSKNEFFYLKNENMGNCIFTEQIEKEKLLRLPIGHAEGRVLFPEGMENIYLKRLVDQDQIVFRYTKTDGSYPEGEYPYNPNGSFFDIAGICNPKGNVMGMMPHPERAFYGWQLPDYTRMEKKVTYGDGKLIFESAIKYLEDNF